MKEKKKGENPEESAGKRLTAMKGAVMLQFHMFRLKLAALWLSRVENVL